VIVAAQAVQRYRLTRIAVIRGAPPGPGGPQICRSRVPCPQTTRRAPSGLLASPQHGQWLGRASDVVGCRETHVLTSQAACISLPLLPLLLKVQEARQGVFSAPTSAPPAT